ncbi:unnamed protein product [Sphenostylis stenocarpa]|uniref:Remorin C-terminal domain-containing protein n=1 Tax=Sphenostylis stenocarpa TaxID=92480 RepID=A0AA86V9T5_9FABA|nr:unnamed protein product [Sphenostylis stenocarpa]
MLQVDDRGLCACGCSLRERKRERDDTWHHLEAACKAYFTLLAVCCMLLWSLENCFLYYLGCGLLMLHIPKHHFGFLPIISLNRNKISGLYCRVSFSDAHSPKHHGSSSSKNDKAWNWLPRITSHDDYIRDDEYLTSVAAAAFAIHSLEEAELRDLNKMREQPKSSRLQTMIREEDDISKRQRYGEPSMKRSFDEDPRTKETAFPVRRQSSISTSRPVSPALGYQRQQGTPFPHKNTKARPENCEKAMIKMIQKQYEMIKSKILSWELVKTFQAKVQGAKQMQNYRSKVTREDVIAQGAGAALEGRRREESKVRKNSNKNRKTSTVPVKCLCCNS